MRHLRTASVLFIFLLSSEFTVARAKPAVEIVPVAVWQGRSQSTMNGAILNELRKAWPDSRMAHAVSAAPFLRGETSRRAYKEQLSSLIRVGDDVVLHMAPWKSLANKASVSYRYDPTLFGVHISEAECSDDCGLDLSFTAFSSGEISQMIGASRQIFSENDLGAPADHRLPIERKAEA